MCSRWQTVISIIVCRVVISQVNQCHVATTAVNLTLADRWHSICDSFTALNTQELQKIEVKNGIYITTKTKKFSSAFFFC